MVPETFLCICLLVPQFLALLLVPNSSYGTVTPFFLAPSFFISVLAIVIFFGWDLEKLTYQGGLCYTKMFWVVGGRIEEMAGGSLLEESEKPGFKLQPCRLLAVLLLAS